MDGGEEGEVHLCVVPLRVGSGSDPRGKTVENAKVDFDFFSAKELRKAQLALAYCPTSIFKDRFWNVLLRQAQISDIFLRALLPD